MSERFVPSEEALQTVAALAERKLTAEEWDAYVNAPWTEDELRETRELIAWFNRRYPTAAARLAYARKHTLAQRRAQARRNT
jgi:hypothetical protein